MNEMNYEKAPMENKNASAENRNADFSRYLAYQDAVKSLRGNADGSK